MARSLGAGAQPLRQRVLAVIGALGGKAHRKRICRLVAAHGGLVGARWIDVGNYHVTLRFIGDIDARAADEIADYLVQVRRSAFAVEIAGLGAFGGRQPHSVYATQPSRMVLTMLDAR